MKLAARLHELWAYRELTYNLVVRDLKVRYKNSALGVLWSLLNPLLMMLVFTFVFGVVYANNPKPAYPAFILSGILAWNLFSTSVNGATKSIVSNAHLIKKVYFPREILPLAEVLANLVHYLLGLPVYFALALALGVTPTRWVLFLPAVILVQLCFTLGISFVLATVNVFYRDTQIVMEVIMQAWFFMTPIFYSIDQVLPQGIQRGDLVLSAYDAQRLMRIINPMASIVASYRDVLYRGYQPGIDFFMRTAVTALLFLVVGYLIFQRYSYTFGEEI